MSTVEKKIVIFSLESENIMQDNIYKQFLFENCLFCLDPHFHKSKMTNVAIHSVETITWTVIQSSIFIEY